MGTRETRRVVVEGNLVSIERSTVERELKLSDLIQELLRTEPVVSGMLPPGCIWFGRSRGQNESVQQVYVIHRPAGPYKFRYTMNKRSSDREPERPTELTLSWPDSLWFVCTKGNVIDSVVPAFIYETLENVGFNATLYDPLLPNIYRDGTGRMCIGNDLRMDVTVPLEQRVAKLMQYLLVESTWNRDLIPPSARMVAAGFKVESEGSSTQAYHQWAERTAQDAKAWRSIDFPRTRDTYGIAYTTAAATAAKLLNVRLEQDGALPLPPPVAHLAETSA